MVKVSQEEVAAHARLTILIGAAVAGLRTFSQSWQQAVQIHRLVNIWDSTRDVQRLLSTHALSELISEHCCGKACHDRGWFWARLWASLWRRSVAHRLPG